MQGNQMQLPIDTSGMTFFVSVPPEPVVDFKTKQPKVDGDGQPLHMVQLNAVLGRSAAILPVKFAGEPGLLASGTPVRVAGLVATPWEKDGRSGVSYRAERIDAAVPAGRNGSAAEKS